MVAKSYKIEFQVKGLDGSDDIILVLLQNRLQRYGHVLREKTMIG